MSGQVYKQMKRLRNANDAREFMQATINAVDKNKIDIQKGRCLGYLIKVFLKSFEVAELEERVEKLEQLAERRSKQ